MKLEGCMMAVIAALGVGWLVFCGFMIFWLVSWLTSK